MFLFGVLSKSDILIPGELTNAPPQGGQRFSDKFPTAGTDKITNTTTTTIIIKFINEMASTRK